MDAIGMLVWIGLAAAVALAAWRASRRRVRQRHLMLLCRRVGLRFMPLDPFGDTAWLPFGWMLPGRWVQAENVVWHADDPAARAFDLVLEQRSAGGDAPTTRRMTCAVIPLGAGCPRMVAGPHGAIDHVAGALLEEGVALELEEFNRRFAVRSDDRRFAVAFCDQRMMEAMLCIPGGINVAVNEDLMLLHGTLLPPARVLLLLEAARALHHAVPSVIASLYPPRPAKGPHEDRWLQGHWSPEPIGEG